MSDVQLVAITEFIEEVKAEYTVRQNDLRPFFTMQTGVIGDTAHFPTSGSIVAVPRTSNQIIVPQTVPLDKAIVTLKGLTASTTVDIIDQITVNFDLRRIMVTEVTDAMIRGQLQQMIDALEAATVDTIAAGVDYNYAIVRQVVRNFAEKNIIGAQVASVISPFAQDTIMNDPKFIDNDFVTKGAVMRGGISHTSNMGINWLVLGEMEEGGLPITGGNLRTTYVWDRRAVGMAVGLDPQLTVTQEGLLQNSWLIQSNSFSNALVIDPRGVIKVTIDES